MKRFAFLLLLAATCLAVHGCSASADENRMVRVMLTENEHYSIVSENPVLVPAGQNAVFQLEVDENYAVTELTDDAVYEDGVITVPAVKYPTTVDTVCVVPEYYWFEYRYSPKEGNIQTSIPSNKYMQGTEVTITAIPEEGSIFLGFSEGKSLSAGGTIISTDTSYTFKLQENVVLYPNYVGADTFLLQYDANGGTLADSDGTTTISTNSSEFYYCPNALLNKGQFVREGYALLGYNTKADGTGEYYGSGWNVDLGDAMTGQLYCQWVEYSPAEDFEYSIKKNTVTIKGYTGDDEFVVIPEYIEGKPVTTIDKTAFQNCTFKTVYITRNVTTILLQAFKDCKNLETVYLTDAITDMQDNTFSGCDNYKTLYINGVLDPQFAYAEGGVAGVKYERLLHHKDDKKIIVISGSSSLYGLSTPQLTEEMNNEYTVINMGIHANTPCVFFMEMCAAFTKEGDIVVNAPEPMSEQWGSVSFNGTFWGIFECCLGAISKVDISHYSSVYSTFASFNKSRTWLNYGRDYDFHDSNSDHNGDLNYYRGLMPEDHITMVNGIQDFSRTACHTKMNIKNFNYAVEKITSTGAISLMSFSPINVNILSEDSRDKAYRVKYQTSADDNYDSILISKLDDYIMSGSYFSNTDLHPNNPGTEIRTTQLANDIKAYLADPASYD